LKKKQFFEQEKSNKSTKNALQAESARDLLRAATRVRDTAYEEYYKTLSSKKSKGKLAATVPDTVLRRTALSEGWLAQSNHLLHTGITTNQYIELEGAISALERQHGGSTMTTDYGNLSEDRAALQRSRNTRIVDLSSSDERRGINRSSDRESSSNPPFSILNTPEFIREERKAKIRRVRTRASMRMIDPSITQSGRKKAFVVQNKLATENVAYVKTVCDLMPVMPASQDLLQACLTQASFELKDSTNTRE